MSGDLGIPDDAWGDGVVVTVCPESCVGDIGFAIEVIDARAVGAETRVGVANWSGPEVIGSRAAEDVADDGHVDVALVETDSNDVTGLFGGRAIDGRRGKLTGGVVSKVGQIA